jgi:hypothetical protein
VTRRVIWLLCLSFLSRQTRLGLHIHNMLPVMLSLPFLLPLSVTSKVLHAPSHHQPNGNVSRYAHAHSYNPVYTFHRRDGWGTVPVSDLAYKYVQANETDRATAAHGPHGRRERRSRTVQQKGQKGQKNQKGLKNISNGITGTFNHVVNAALKGIGKIEQVTITWCVLMSRHHRVYFYTAAPRRYTGKDLLNPSCWQKAVWAPSVRLIPSRETAQG